MSQLSALPPPSRPTSPAAASSESTSPTAHEPAFLQHLDAATRSTNRPTSGPSRQDSQGSRVEQGASQHEPSPGRSPKVSAANRSQASTPADGEPAAPPKTAPLSSSRDMKRLADAKDKPADSDKPGLDKPDTTASGLVNTMLALIHPATSPVTAASDAGEAGDAGGSGAAANASALAAPMLAAMLSATGATGIGSAAATGGEADVVDLGEDATSSAAAAATLAAIPGTSVSAALAPLLAVNGLPDQKSSKQVDTLQQSLAMLAPTAQDGAMPAAMHALALPSTGDAHAFQQQLGQQVAWLSGQDIKQASIRLHPQDLGQLDIKVSVDQGQVNVAFNAQHPAAVAAVQQTLPQLGHMLAQHGLALGHAEVGQQGNGSQPYPGREQAERGNGSLSPDGSDEISASVAPAVAGLGLLDAFA